MPVFFSVTLISAVLEITISTSLPSLFLPLTVRKSSMVTFPSNFAVNLFSSEIFPATPPTWNVRNVNCVPGSPIDCAAITPTASPICTLLRVDKLCP
jgi:hypothetical protein